MTQALIEVGEKIHLVTRRHFKEDVRRHFAGTVIVASAGMVRAEGYTFIVSPIGNDVKRLNGIRIRLFGLDGSDHIVNVLPQDIEIKRLTYQAKAGVLAITDGQKFWMEVNEHI